MPRRCDGWWTTVRDWTALPSDLQRQLARAETRLGLLETQIAALEDQ